MSVHAALAWAAVAALVAIFAILSAGAFARLDERKRKDAAREDAQRKLELLQRDKAAAMKRDGTHLFKRPVWKSSVVHIAPARTELPRPSNVAQIRKVKR